MENLLANVGKWENEGNQEIMRKTKENQRSLQLIQLKGDNFMSLTHLFLQVHIQYGFPQIYKIADSTNY